ncbi:MAG: hypothetical protein P1U82_05740 [Verrucomicrobiales bacterium]|nr:hypothetical protein [Verrucomicrobiales bacterium]
MTSTIDLDSVGSRLSAACDQLGDFDELCCARLHKFANVFPKSSVFALLVLRAQEVGAIDCNGFYDNRDVLCDRIIDRCISWCSYLLGVIGKGILAVCQSQLIAWQP